MEEKLKQQPANCIKVVLFGPESTGKTTLSRQLARHYNSIWVPEYAREYLQNKWNNERKTCEAEDLLPIAYGQMQLENELVKKTNSVLICDTDLLETKVYSDAYYVGSCDPILEKYALQNTYNLYFLTYIDVPWVDDDLRDKPERRVQMFKAFKDALIKHNRPYVLLKGDKQTRLQTAINHINELFKHKTMNFSENDLQQIENNGLTLEKVNSQIDLIKSGMAFSNLKKAATIGDGILKIDNETAYLQAFKTKSKNKKLIKFVPASGAASRMFKFLFAFIKDYNPEEESLTDFIARTDNKMIEQFSENLEKSPLYDAVMAQVSEDFANFSKDKQCHELVKFMLGEEGLNYGFFPKGLLPFHKYESNTATAFEEHFYEAALYASSNGEANLHFTISEAHQNKFLKELEAIKTNIEAKTNTRFNVSFSFQKSSTETIAIKADDTLYRENDGSLLFRPSGHGALIENLNDLNADVIFVKNIDNVVVKKHHESISESKKILAGVLLEVQEQAFKYLELMDEASVSEEIMLEIAAFLTSKLNVVLTEDFDDLSSSEKQAYLKTQLNKPIRVCGMVKNEGEPGGGPFWVEDENGTVSLQIVESAQIDTSNKEQSDILSNATHFNPVDLICATKNYKGEKFNLLEYVDHNTSFITMKSKNGIDIKALELPGLWNGSMAFWNTIFVEVPLETFNPVKTANDLLKPAHQEA
ncbi:DUF4301 family protein [Neotamlana laminarinivorans]|uniref:DUF4301 family protein n=1 Tax=Neotamlana laminarinivorans TaxID=2883124 RepID=A0A9X1I1M0_9FLAO|nr:DUF4301 family protein [Tamlana laminarinivorans]MCB4799780.1 DUF4301 family protein [Tamlana laminarinivorans]